MVTPILASSWHSPGLLSLLDPQDGRLLGMLEARPDGYVLWFPRWEGTPDPDEWPYLETPVGSFFDDIADAAKSVYGAAKGAVSSVASFVHHPPGWLAAALPLFTTENQRYWAQTLGGSTGAQLYDAGVKAVATKALGPQGPQLVDAYNKVVEDASQGHIDAIDILHHAPQIAKLAVASQQGPAAFQAAVAATRSNVRTPSPPSWGRGVRRP